MAARSPSRAIRFAGLLCLLAIMVAPAQAGLRTHARLVRCGAVSCLRLSGHRPGAATVVRVGAYPLAVTGGRAWQATVPLATARGWPIARGYALHVILADPEAGTERSEQVPLPPGALGSRTEIASLVVDAP